jgi:hypothetical protein
MTNKELKIIENLIAEMKIIENLIAEIENLILTILKKELLRSKLN